MKYLETAADLSECLRYRTRLCRRWKEWPTKRVCFIMLNPSTANSIEDDPTIRRCVNFADSWGFGVLDVVNLYSFITSSPKELFKADYPHGLGNMNAIVQTATHAEFTVAAWGVFGKKSQLEGIHLAYTLLTAGVDLRALKVTKHGHPGHPLYLPKNAEPLPYAPKGYYDDDWTI